MKKTHILTLLLMLTVSVAFGQTPYKLNYPDITIGNSPTGKIVLNGSNLRLPRIADGSLTDSVLTIVSGVIKKVPRSQFSGGGGLTYTAGYGLNLTETEFKVDSAIIRTVNNSFTKAQTNAIINDAIAGIKYKNVLIVGKPDSKFADYNTITDAINNAGDSDVNTITIIVMPGTYEENLILIDRNINLVGIDRERTVILDRTGDYYNPPLEVSGNFYASNLTFKSTSELAITPPAIPSYAVHADFYGEGVTKFYNCNVISEQNAAFGIGLHSNQTFIIEQCYLQKSGSYDGGSLYFHNSPNPEVNQKLIVKNSVINSISGHVLKIDDARQDAGGLDLNTTVSFYNNSFWSGDLFGGNDIAVLYPSVNGGISGRINITRDSYGNSLKLLNVLYPLPYPINESVENYSVPLRDGGGHINANFFHTNANLDSFIPTSIFSSNGDGFIRRVGISQIDTALNVYNKANINGGNNFNGNQILNNQLVLNSALKFNLTTPYDITTDANGFNLAETSVAYRFFIQKTTGRVGIGTVNPQSQLDVDGNIRSSFLSGVGDSPIGVDASGTLKRIASSSYTLPIASSTVLGGVKVGSGLAIDGDGVLSTEGSSFKAITRAATTGNIALSGLLTVDGVSLQAGERVLVKNQSTSSQNGIYIAASGSWSRSSDADTGAELTGLSVAVSSGTANASSVYTQTSNVSVLGSTSVIFAQAFKAGTGIATSGNTISIAANQSLSGVTTVQGFKAPTSLKTANYTITTTDYTIRADASGAARIITLPTAASVFSNGSGQIFNIKKTDSSANTVTIQANGAETIDGTNTKVITSQNSTITIQSNGTSWDVIL